MKRGWIRFWRKVQDNQIFRHDRTAWHIFEVLFINCNKETGSWEGGRFQLAVLSDEKPITTYKALKRLKKAKMVTQVSNNRYSVIHICKWKQYQPLGNTSGE